MRLPFVLAAALLAATANAQDDFDYWPNADYDPAGCSGHGQLGFLDRVKYAVWGSGN